MLFLLVDPPIMDGNGVVVSDDVVAVGRSGGEIGSIIVRPTLLTSGEAAVGATAPFRVSP